MNPIIKKLSKLKNLQKAKLLAGFFKTGKGEYGEGDIFWGINVSEQRRIAKECVGTSFAEIQELLNSGVHECRLTGLLILTYKYEKIQKASGMLFPRKRVSLEEFPSARPEPDESRCVQEIFYQKNTCESSLKSFMDSRLRGNDMLDTEKREKQIFDFYVKNIKYINNWDLVDVTCHKIVGAYLFNKDRRFLYKLARSKKLWEKRISIISTFYFIRKNDFLDSLKLAEILLHDKHDLIHKAVGWILREVGKKEEKLLHDFLKKYPNTMPRTALRYAIERLPIEWRNFYMLRKHI